MIAFVAVLVFMVLAYGLLFGGISVIALLVNGIMIVAAMSMTQATLTLPGIAGLILTLAVAVDANVLIYERMRDEIRAGRTPLAAADAGFSRAMLTIFDANITHLGASIIMFGLGAGPVKGFAWTLAIGVFTSVFSAVLVTQVLLAFWFRVTRPNTETKGFWPIIKLIPIKTNFRMMRFAFPLAMVSLVLCIGSLVATVIPFTPPCGGLNCGVDFKGGTLIEISTAPKAIDQERLVDLIQSRGVKDVQVQGIGAPNAAGGQTAANIRYMTPDNVNPAQKMTEIRGALTQTLGK
eukprot:gene26167-26347_t